MKKLITFLLCFTLLAVGVTYGCIQYTLREPAAEDQPAETGIDLNGFYNENDLMIAEHTEWVGDVEIKYPQIDGLKSAEVQTLVNDTIRGEVERLKTQYAELGGNIRYLTWQENANFGNVLSLGLYSGDDAMHYEQMYLNFDLNNGSLLQLEDLFGKQANLQMIVHSAFYDALTRGNLYQTYGEEFNYPDENALYKTVKGYLSGEMKFAFTPWEIYLYYGEYTASVSMVEFAEDIVVYGKYLSDESLFVEDGVGYDGMFTCARIPKGYVQRQFGFAAENFWYDVALSEPYFNEFTPAAVKSSFTAYSDNLYGSLLTEVEKIRLMAEAQTDKAYILLASPDVYIYRASEQVGNEWTEIPSCAAEVNENYTLYEMSAVLFETKYRQELVNLYRTGAYSIFFGGLDQVIADGEVQVSKRNTVELYNYETGNKLTIEDVFVEGYDYMDAIRRQQKYDLAGYYGYTLESAEEALQGAWVELAGSSVRIFLPEWGTDRYLTMAFSQFPRTALTIFD